MLDGGMSFRRSLAIGLLAMAALRVSILAGFIGLHGLAGIDDPYSGRPEVFAALAAVALLQIGVVLGMRRALGVSFAELGWRAEAMPRQLAWGLGGFAVIASAMLALLAAAGMGPGEVRDAMLGLDGAQRLTALSIGCLAAFAEESVFRGHLQPLLAARLGLVKGSLLVAVIFDLYHLAFAPLALAMKLVIGLVLAFLRARVGSLFAPAIAHALTWLTMGPL